MNGLIQDGIGVQQEQTCIFEKVGFQPRETWNMALYCAQQEHGSVMLHNVLQSQSRWLCTILSGHIWRFCKTYGGMAGEFMI
jgi:hypothetical protein